MHPNHQAHHGSERRYNTLPRPDREHIISGLVAQICTYYRIPFSKLHEYPEIMGPINALSEGLDAQEESDVRT